MVPLRSSLRRRKAPSITRICAATALAIACASHTMPEPKTEAPAPSASPSRVGEEPSPETTTQKAASTPSAEPEISAEAAGVCDLVCEQAKVGGLDGSSDLDRVTKNANGVLQEMQPDILACYRKRIVAKPQTHAFMTLDILVGSDGKVLRVDTTGGALLGEKTLGCIVKRVEKGAFEPPRRGGTLHIFVPFTLHRAAPGAAAE